MIKAFGTIENRPGAAEAASAGSSGIPHESRESSDQPDRSREDKIADIKRYLVRYLELRPDQDIDGVRFEAAADLPGEYGDQYRFLDDSRLAGVEVAVVPDGLWVKGIQPSESHAEKGLILIREGYYDRPERHVRDQAAWLTHELAHVQRSLDRGPDDYRKDSDEPAFDDIGLNGYPNNKVEEHAFTRQLEYLKTRGIGRDAAAALLREQYDPEDFRFLDRILDRVYGAA